MPPSYCFINGLRTCNVFSSDADQRTAQTETKNITSKQFWISYYEFI